jgi:integrase
MARNGTRSRLFRRGSRYWADLRTFSDVGGKREPLVAPGEKSATTDRTVAEALLGDRIRELEARRRNRALLGTVEQVGLAEYASHHLLQKAKSGRVTDDWLKESEAQLRRAVEFFGEDRDLGSIGVRDVQDFTHWLQAIPSPRGGTLSPGTVRHYLNTLSNLFRRAQGEEVVRAGHNPVAGMLEKPIGRSGEAAWLEVHESALLLEAARHHGARQRDHLPFAHALIGTFLLTGGRKNEVLGLLVDDISFDRRTVVFRVHAHRRVKTQTSRRVVPLWPQLEEILRQHVFQGGHVSGLLFPSPRTGGMIRDTRKTLDAVAARAGWDPGDIRTKMFRHTYCAARLQTLDHGAPVSPFTVGRELGHGGDSLVKRIYGHLGEVRHRSEVVEYRVENHRDQLADRLRLLE